MTGLGHVRYWRKINVNSIFEKPTAFQPGVLSHALHIPGYAGDGSVAVLAVLAGNDMIVTTDFEEQIPLVADAVRTGLIAAGRPSRAIPV